MARKDNKLNMKSIFINDCEYGLRRLKRKVERLKRRQENLEQIESLSLYGAEDLGRIKEAIYIYEDLIDISFHHIQYEKYSDCDDCYEVYFTKNWKESTYPDGYISFYKMERNDYIAEKEKSINITLEKFMRLNA